MMAHIHTCVLWDFIVSLSASEVSAIASVVSAIASSGLLILAIFAGRTATQTLRASEEASEAAREQIFKQKMTVSRRRDLMCMLRLFQELCASGHWICEL